MGQCKKHVTPLLMHWSYVFLALTHRCALWHFNDGYIVCNALMSTQNDGWRYHRRHFSYTSMIPLVFMINILCDFLSPIWQWNTMYVRSQSVFMIYLWVRWHISTSSAVACSQFLAGVAMTNISMQLALPYSELDYLTYNRTSRHGTGYTFTWPRPTVEPVWY